METVYEAVYYTGDFRKADTFARPDAGEGTCAPCLNSKIPPPTGAKAK
jgi:hypothetical protein